jgi:GH24 family phage-related lysozyme (muramidase)
MTLIEQLLNEEEGPSSPTVYYVAGIAHIGRGVCIDARVPGAGLPSTILEDLDAVEIDAAIQRAMAIPGFDKCNDVQKATLVSLCYQLGAMDWPQFRAGMAKGDYDYAADALLYKNADDKSEGPTPFKQETPERADREAEMLRKGVWVPK